MDEVFIDGDAPIDGDGGDGYVDIDIPWTPNPGNNNNTEPDDDNYGGGGGDNNNPTNYEPVEDCGPGTSYHIALNACDEETDCQPGYTKNEQGLCVEDENNDPCKNLKEKITAGNANIKPEIEALQATLLQIGENGVKFNKTNGAYANNRLPPTTTNSINFVVGGTSYGGAHTHPVGSGIHPMFSWGDIYVLMSFYLNAAQDVKDEVTFMLVTKATTTSANANIYALSVVDWIKLRNSINQDINAIVQENAKLTFASPLQEKIKALVDKVGDLYDKGNNYENTFLNRFANYGIKLYKANADINTWSELKTNSTLGPVFEVPCN